jgi:hypothetical protein
LFKAEGRVDLPLDRPDDGVGAVLGDVGDARLAEALEGAEAERRNLLADRDARNDVARDVDEVDCGFVMSIAHGVPTEPLWPGGRYVTTRLQPPSAGVTPPVMLSM